MQNMSTPPSLPVFDLGEKNFSLGMKNTTKAGNIIRSNGLTTNRYNQLSHILGKRKDLRGRVQHQAYLYRVNADLRGTKIRPLPDPIVVGAEGDAAAPTSPRSKAERRRIVNRDQQVMMIMMMMAS